MAAIIVYTVLIGCGTGLLQFLVARKIDRKIKEINDRINKA